MKIQKISQGHRRKNHNNLLKMVRFIKNPSVLPSRKETSLTQSVNKVITYLTISLPIEYPKNKLIEGSPSPKIRE